MCNSSQIPPSVRISDQKLGSLLGECVRRQIPSVTWKSMWHGRAGKCGRELPHVTAWECLWNVLEYYRQGGKHFSLSNFSPSSLYLVLFPSLNVKVACCLKDSFSSSFSHFRRSAVPALQWSGRDQVWVQVVNGAVTSFPECFCGLSFGPAVNWTRLLSTSRLCGERG